jgi:gluconate 2-dehydrogenase gamma chain
MACRAEWPVVQPPVAVDSDERLFFDEHQWDTIEAATARIIPTDHDPGAREAKVVRFIDRYLSGTDYIFAAADGSGFLKMDGKDLEAWESRIATLQQLYREGIQALDAEARGRFDADFATLSETQQDQVLTTIGGVPPEPLAAGRRGAFGTVLQSVGDDGLGFFDALALHTRQGFFGDPAYGGNEGRVGWKVIGFPGPESLADTRDCSYSVEHLSVHDRDWADLIPHLRDKEHTNDGKRV